MKDVVTQSDRSPRLIEFLSILFALLALGVTIILSVLKYDGLTRVSKWPWIMVILPSLGVAFGCVVLWTIFHYYRAGTTTPLRWTQDTSKQIINNVQVDQIEIYHERYLFRDVLMVFCHFVTVAYAAMILINPCPPTCTTPFSMFAVAVFVLNGLRLLLLVFRAYFDYHRLRETCAELRIYLAWRDENRLYHHVIPSIVPQYQYNVYAITEGVLFCAMVLFIALGTIWIESGSCMNTCNKGYYMTSHLLVALYMIEAVYLLSTIALVFFKRTSGLEIVEEAFDRINNAKKYDDKYKKERMSIINDTDPY